MIDLADIQGFIRSSYDHLSFGRFLFLHIQEAAAARDWLKHVVPEVATAQHWPKGQPKPKTKVTLAFTASGLRQLGLTDEALQTFPREFVDGMAAPNRVAVLGDTDESAPKHWQVGGTQTPEVHALLILFALDAESLNALTDQVWGTPAGVQEVYRQDSVRTSPYEPFGFRDGISQPAIEGLSHHVKGGQDVLKTGEIIFGYENEYGQPSAPPTVSSAADTDNQLPVSASDPARKEFGRNGSLLVWRKIKQDVEGFWRFLDEQTRNPDGTSNPAMQEWLGAKLVGRWRSGAPLVLAPEADDPALGADARRNNDFLFMPKDPYGYACPIGSHVRRSNPRDSLPPNPTKSAEVSKRHRILRRGKPYEDMGGEGGAAKEQGLLFICLNTDLGRQFEFIQQTWVNSPKFGGQFDNKDPLVSDNNGQGTMVIQGQPVRRCIHGLPRFVTVRGGGYFFLPGLRALHFLARDGVRNGG